MGATVYAVMAESEYHESAWICGIYATEQEAMTAFDAAVARRAAWDAWSKLYEAERVRVAKGAQVLSAPQIAAIRAAIPPEPPDEAGHHFEVIEAPMGRWFANGPDAEAPHL